MSFKLIFPHYAPFPYCRLSKLENSTATMEIRESDTVGVAVHFSDRFKLN